ncbi:MAG: GNAT family N-acetyltransferase [Kangiellaceae bacterium]|nr:GNAT family N-acetyltransferase [Kangiellaceae bacterium]MCW8999522.1 GNAT family N-acetyltransferase [Kangiellaceae bacterium]
MFKVEFIAYKPKYKSECIELFKSNLNGYFSPEEVKDYAQFLDSSEEIENYYVGFLDGEVVAAGGWDRQNKGYFLRWGIIDNSRHKLGLGTQLLEFRIGKIEILYGKVDILIKTSGKAHGFFEKFGFETCQIIPDGIFSGIDEYQMVRRLE